MRRWPHGRWRSRGCLVDRPRAGLRHHNAARRSGRRCGSRWNCHGCACGCRRTAFRSTGFFDSGSYGCGGRRRRVRWSRCGHGRCCGHCGCCRRCRSCNCCGCMLYFCLRRAGRGRLGGDRVGGRLGCDCRMHHRRRSYNARLLPRQGNNAAWSRLLRPCSWSSSLWHWRSMWFLFCRYRRFRRRRGGRHRHCGGSRFGFYCGRWRGDRPGACGGCGSRARFGGGRLLLLSLLYGFQNVARF